VSYSEHKRGGEGGGRERERERERESVEVLFKLLFFYLAERRKLRTLNVILGIMCYVCLKNKTK